MILLSFLLIAGILTLEGFLLSQIVLRTKGERLLSLMMGYPLGAFINAFVFFVIHILGIAFYALAVGLTHAIIVGLLFVVSRSIASRERFALHLETEWNNRTVNLLCITLLGITIIATAAYAVFLPPYYWDGFTSWAMRAQQSFTAGVFVTEGVSQPQYPILIHALYLAYSIIPGWTDAIVKPSTLLLSLSIFGSVFVLIRRMHGTTLALLTITLVTGIPLALIHLRQGYADIHVAGFSVLSAVLLYYNVNKQHETDGASAHFLLFSAIFCAVAAWTKWEGLYFAVVPWIVVITMNGVFVRFRFQAYAQGGQTCRPADLQTTTALATVIALASPWPLYAAFNGLLLSPHGGSFAFNVGALPIMFDQLFLLGTFGLHWYAIVIFLIILGTTKNILPILRRNPILLWGIITTMLLVSIYLFTKETRGLIQGDNFSRAMLLPTMLLTVGLCTSINFTKIRSSFHLDEH